MIRVMAFFRLIRWPNLVFIVLTQVLFFFCILQPELPSEYYSLPKHLGLGLFVLLVIASVLIAAAGYIINDYFDVNIDQVNKPDRLVVERHIGRRWAMLWHMLLTSAGLALSAYVAWKTSWLVLIGNVTSAILLWFYSTRYKKKLLSGNVLIGLLTAWTILVLFVAMNTTYLFHHEPVHVQKAMHRVYQFAVVYGGFAFIITLIREAVKDMEDMFGDRKYGCRTLPIVWGIPAARMYVSVWTMVLIGAMLVLIGYALLLGWWMSAAYLLLLVVLPLGWIIRHTWHADVPAEYHRVSSAVKGVMFFGILSMLFFR